MSDLFLVILFQNAGQITMVNYVISNVVGIVSMEAASPTTERAWVAVMGTLLTSCVLKQGRNLG
jgi:hypothetical protein